MRNDRGEALREVLGATERAGLKGSSRFRPAAELMKQLGRHLAESKDDLSRTICDFLSTDKGKAYGKYIPLPH